MRVHARAMDVAEPWYLSGGISAANCVAAYAAKGAASLAASYSNLNNPGTNDLTVGVAPTWDATNGLKFNGANQYLIAPTQTTSDWSMLMRFSNKTRTSTELLCGAISGGNRGMEIGFDVVTGDTAFYGNGGSPYMEVSPRITNGVIGISNKTVYRNGSAEGTLGAGAGVPGIPIYLGAVNASGAVLHGLFYCQYYVLYNTEISAAQVLAVTNAMNAL